MKYAFDGTRYLSPETRLRAEMRQHTCARWLKTYTTNRSDRRFDKALKRVKQRMRVVRA
ncbi:MAG: hypothetical protein M0R44_10150 [Candidatus Marinimicrobia bacterium]|jgi:hypothetical protein|nr:hypothetical protein [Candidatus Neomarinimicrobiota bacterium]